MSISRLVYVSTARPDLPKREVDAILDVARTRNADCDVTGLLVYDGKSFMQLLEGEEGVIDKIFRSISRDERHSGIMRILYETGVERQFRKWSMGYSLTHDPRMLRGDDWFPLTSPLLEKALPRTLDPTLRVMFTSFLSVEAIAAMD